MKDVPEDLAAWCRSAYPRLVGLIDVYCGDLQVAEDVAQETLLKVCRDWRRVRRMNSPTSWANRVAINLANTHFRRRGAERRAYSRSQPIPGDDRHHVDQGEAVAVRAAVSRLPRRQRAVLVLRFYAGHSVGETAELLGLPTGTVKSLSHRAMGALRRELGDEPFPVLTPDNRSLTPEVPHVR